LASQVFPPIVIVCLRAPGACVTVVSHARCLFPAHFVGTLVARDQMGRQLRDCTSRYSGVLTPVPSAFTGLYLWPLPGAFSRWLVVQVVALALYTVSSLVTRVSPVCYSVRLPGGLVDYRRLAVLPVSAPGSCGWPVEVFLRIALCFCSVIVCSRALGACVDSVFMPGAFSRHTLWVVVQVASCPDGGVCVVRY